MAKQMKQLRVAMAAWEIGRIGSGLGTKIGGLGVILEELPRELVRAAKKKKIDLEIEILSPCFAHYDKTKLEKLDFHPTVTLAGQSFQFDTYKHIFEEDQETGKKHLQTAIYFWDEWQLNWTSRKAIYPDDRLMAFRLYALASQAMAAYIEEQDFDVVHLHDYHVGMIPFYLGEEYLEKTPVHFTVHNATYQGLTPTFGSGHDLLRHVGLPGELFPRYFEFFGYANPMKACMLKVHESGGRTTTVSGDLEGSWGYAAELRRTQDELTFEAYTQKGSHPGAVFVPNQHLDLFERLSVIGITNGMSRNNRADRLPQLKFKVLREAQKKRRQNLFRHPEVQKAMLAENHNFSVDSLGTKVALKRLLHLEAFGTEPAGNPILLTVVGRLAAQKNLGLVADVIEPSLARDPGVKFIIQGSAPDGDPGGKADEERFARLAASRPDRVYYNSSFNVPLSRLILAGGDFALIPSRFEPCGLVDYEASLLGNVVIGRATGGLVKVAHCGYLYDWLDISDHAGEVRAFLRQIFAAIETYRRDPARQEWLVRTAMEIDASWDASAAQYVSLYRYGLLAKKWHAKRHGIARDFARSLGASRKLFSSFYAPGRGAHGDALDRELRKALDES